MHRKDITESWNTRAYGAFWTIQFNLFALEERRQGGSTSPKSQRSDCSPVSPLLGEEMGRAGCSAESELMRAGDVSALYP